MTATTLSKKQQAHAAAIHRTPFSHWQHPTPLEAQQVCDLLASVHGMPERPKVLVDLPGAPAGCGNVPSVLDALVRTILSANTTSKNSTAAKVSMDQAYGRANYRAVLEGGAAKLEDCIRCGGLAQNKSKAIVNILRRLEQRNVDELGLEPGKGELSLDWLHDLSDDQAMNELISYDSVGIKTASCVLLFCLGRDSFAVDTHVWRITQSLGWLPPNGSTYSHDDPPKKVKQTSNPPSRDQTFYHLDHLLPAHLKYPLHSLLVRHGRGCVRCAANGVTTQDFVDECPIDHLVKRKKGKYTSSTSTKHKGVVKSEQGETVGHVVPNPDARDEAAGKVKFEPLRNASEEDKAKVVASLGSRKRKAVKLEEEAGQPRVGDDEVEGSYPSLTKRGRTAASKKPERELPDHGAGGGAAQGLEQGGRTLRRRSTRASAAAAATAIKHEVAADQGVDEDSDLTDLSGGSSEEEDEARMPRSASGRNRMRANATKAKTARRPRFAVGKSSSSQQLMKSSKPAATRAAASKPIRQRSAGGASVARDEAEMAGQVYTMHGMEV
ncbi:hypothetical protein JCM3774_000021 [Rhodotorula dairenensis]